ncbi:MAG: hypothetical protein Q8M20_03460 [Rhodocyclaceae bacterium]|nr:hypothetical protein [Rhodocyclaceae bacterium]MDZ4213436.1 hypothetical protein [Rhodocyclaceae bacterium]
MSEDKQAAPETPEVETTDLLSRINPAILIAVTVGATLVALLAIISLLMLVSLSSDVSHLEDQMRKMSKVTKAMEQELTDLRDTLAERAPVAATKAAPPPVQPTHIDTADPANDCVIRSGSKNGLAGCLK